MNAGFFIGLALAVLFTFAIVNQFNLNYFQSAVLGAVLGLTLPWIGSLLDDDL